MFSQLVDLLFSTENEEDEVSDSASIETLQQVSSRSKVLNFLLEPRDLKSPCAMFGRFSLEFNTLVQFGGDTLAVDVLAERYNCDNPRSSISSSESAALCGELGGVGDALLLVLVAANQLGHDLLVRRLAGAGLEGVDLALGAFLDCRL